MSALAALAPPIRSTGQHSFFGSYDKRLVALWRASAVSLSGRFMALWMGRAVSRLMAKGV